MAYIGSSPVVGEFKKLDDISSQFNDSNVIFALTSSGESIVAGTPQSFLISVDGILQEPIASYTVSGSNITFTSAPNTSSTFFGIQLGSVNQIGVPTDFTVTTAKIVNGAVTNVKIADGNVITSKLSDQSVTTDKIADDGVTTVKILNASVTSDKIADGNVITSKIADDAITSIKISPNTIFRGTTTYLGASIERANVIASNITSTVTIDNQNNGIVYYTGNSASNAGVTVNFINMDSVVSGNVTSFVLILTNNANFQAYVGNVNINGATGNVVRWLGGVPTSGDANIDVYSFSVVKTAASSYTTLASKNNFD
jgi:hypothetical protein